MSSFSPELLEQIEELLNVGIALSAEKDFHRLLEMILTEAQRITNADAGTLYIKENDQLVFAIVHNETLGISQGGRGEPTGLPPVVITPEPENVCAYAAVTRQIVNIPDVYASDRFDFTGPRRYDAITGYHTQSMLVLPLCNYDDEVIGVLQLINAKDGARVVPFAPHLEKIIASLASQAAVSLTNMQYIAEINRLFDSFVQAIAAAIDARTPYNVNHTRNVALLAGRLANYIDRLSTGPWAAERFGENRTEQLVKAAWLHDIGKVAIPLEVMDKPTRLAGRLELVLQRLDYIALQLEFACCREANRETRERLQEELVLARAGRDLVARLDRPETFVDDLARAALQELACRKYWDGLGVESPWLTPQELECLSIARGTLTGAERRVMESHVAVTERMLQKIAFNKRLRHVPTWAVLHHELLDGSGYTRGLAGDDIPLEARLLTVLDVYDALTASDRPYKRAMPAERALDILRAMAAEGKLDSALVEVFRKSRVWCDPPDHRDGFAVCKYTENTSSRQTAPVGDRTSRDGVNR